MNIEIYNIDNNPDNVFWIPEALERLRHVVDGDNDSISKLNDSLTALGIGFVFGSGYGWKGLHLQMFNGMIVPLVKEHLVLALRIEALKLSGKVQW